MFLLDDLLLAPVKGVLWLCQQVQKETDHQQFDPSMIKGLLADLQEMYEAGLISEVELRQAESKLLERLQIAQKKEGERTRRSG